MKDDEDKVPPTDLDPLKDEDDNGEDSPAKRARNSGGLYMSSSAKADPAYAALHEKQNELARPLTDWPGENDDRPLEALADELASSLGDLDDTGGDAPPEGATTDVGPTSGDSTAQALPGRMESLFDDDDAPLSNIESTGAAAAPRDLFAAPARAPAAEAENDRVDTDIIEDLIDDDLRQLGDDLDTAADDLPADDTAEDAVIDEEVNHLTEVTTATASGAAIDDAVIDALAEEAFEREATTPRRTRSMGSFEQTADPQADASAAKTPAHPALLQEEPLVDDFLSGLDDDEDVADALEPLPDVATAAPETTPMSATSAASGPEAAGARALSDGTARDETLSPRGTGRGSGYGATAKDPEPGESNRGWKPSWGMLGAVVVALLLLGVGGFGVLEQRGDLEEEIRDLQARLSTAVTPEQAEQYREREAELELRNENLSVELAQITEANAGLQARVDALEDTLRDSQAMVEAERARTQAAIADAQSSAERAAQAATSSVVAPSQTAPDASPTDGSWFVNFGSYAERPMAEDWARRLDVDTGNVVIQATQRGGRNLYRLRVIGLTDRDAAERVATQLERRFDLPRLWVGRN